MTTRWTRIFLQAEPHGITWYGILTAATEGESQFWEGEPEFSQEEPQR